MDTYSPPTAGEFGFIRPDSVVVPVKKSSDDDSVSGSDGDERNPRFYSMYTSSYLHEPIPIPNQQIRLLRKCLRIRSIALWVLQLQLLQLVLLCKSQL